MKNIIKYKLKADSELAALLEGKDDLFVIVCGKCFQEYDSCTQLERDAFQQLTACMGKTVAGTLSLDFLCDRYRTGQALRDAVPEGTGDLFVIACGLGIQTVAGLTKKHVFALADSPGGTGSHGIALTEKRCAACGQCYLDLTGGICPITDCAKSLVNGPCGGAKNGRCEVDEGRACAWDMIYHRLEQQGRLEEYLRQPVQLRDYSKASSRYVSESMKTARERRFESFYGGIHPPERKHFTAHLPLKKLPPPQVVTIPMSMHTGTPAKPLVRAGDTVRVGQKIGEAAGPISAPVHSSVSGTVAAVENRPCGASETALSVVIQSDGKDLLHPSVHPHKPLEKLSPEEIIGIVREAGIVGMGGAGFPTAVKLSPSAPVDTVLLNGCECEPYLTADHRILLEFPDDVIFGLRAILKATGAGRGRIVIEDNKADAAALIQAKIADLDGADVVTVRTKYPQGAERMLVKQVLGRTFPSGGLPTDAGCVVINVSTAKAVSDALRLGMPLVERAVTVAGWNVEEPGNFMVRIGTDAGDLLKHCGAARSGDAIIKMGGPIMGAVLACPGTPIGKTTNGLNIQAPDPAKEKPCIKCGRCVDVCPMELPPLYFARYASEKNWDAMAKWGVLDCIECGCCEYICASKIPLVTRIRAGKRALKEGRHHADHKTQAQGHPEAADRGEEGLYDHL